MRDFFQDESIVAPASGAGGALAVIRISGPLSRAILRARFSSDGRHPADMPRHLSRGVFSDGTGKLLDDCMAVFMAGPASFTGEDVVEIHCHGGQAVVSTILEACVEAGARLAEPGEFSRRAFLNGKIDLSQAEALADLIAAQTEKGRQAALQNLRGGLSARVRTIQSILIDAAAEIEAHLDFPEEDIPEMRRDHLLSALRTTSTQIDGLLATFQRGRMIREGARVVLAGRPNAGKSSLFNALAGRERALVSPHPGTTRDTIETTIDLNGIPVTLIDTAGLRESSDVVEQMGIERTTGEISSADLVLEVCDARVGIESALETVVPAILVLNKSDLLNINERDAHKASVPEAVLLSSTSREGLDALIDRMTQRLIGNNIETESGITRVRHAECLKLAASRIATSITAFESGLSGELVMVDLREAMEFLGDILGERLDEQVLDRIFSTFCLGK